MANKPSWTLQDYVEELNDALGNWRHKIPGMSSLQQTKMAKQTQQIVKAIVSEIGGDGTMQDLMQLGRTDKVCLYELLSFRRVLLHSAGTTGSSHFPFTLMIASD